MKRIEIYLNNNNKLAISEFKSINSEYENKMFKGIETYEYIRKLAKLPIKNIYETDDSVIIECRNCFIVLNDYEKLLEKRGLKPFLDSIKEYLENEKLLKLKNRKVTRKNKHSGKKIIAVGFAFLIIGGTASLLNEQDIFALSKQSGNSNDTSLSDVLLDDNKREYFNIQFINNKYDDNQDTKEKEKFVSISYDDRSHTPKACQTQAYYGNIIKKYAEMYGLDSSLVVAIATQERGIHSEIMDPGGATGLMQIQNSVWRNQKLSAYNYEKGGVETIIVNEESLSDVDYNIKVGCMVLQNTMKYMNNNVLAAIQCYNMGYGNMMKILRAYSSDTNRPVKEILSDIYDIGWMEYRNLISVGDQKYIENVLSWMGTDIKLSSINSDNIEVTLNVSNDLNSKKIY